MADRTDGFDISDILRSVGNPDADHRDIQSSIIAYNIAAIVIAVFTIFVRTCVRAFIVKHVVFEDFLMLGAGAAATALSALIIVGVGHGLGKNIWDLDLLTTLDRVKECIQILFLCQCLHAAALMLVKLSIISTYRRLFPTNRMHYTLAVLALVITSVAIATLFGTLFQCRPVAAAWDFSIERSQCMPVAPLYYFSTSFSAATDVLLCLLPLPFFWKLQVSLREKIIVSSLFGLGLIAAAASVMRLTQLSILQDVNVTMRATPALGWSVGEVIIGIVCACLPCLKPLFNKHLPGTFFTHVHGTKTTTATATTISGTYPIQGPRLQKYPSQALAHLSTSGSGLWRGRGQSWYQRPTLTTVGSWRDGLEETTTTTTTRNKETV